MPSLEWRKADGSCEAYTLTGDCARVGRDSANEVCLDEPLVSRFHARIERRDGRYFVVDMASTNRTRVNGAVVAEQELKDGDELGFARVRCVFRDEAAERPS